MSTELAASGITSRPSPLAAGRPALGEPFRLRRRSCVTRTSDTPPSSRSVSSTAPLRVLVERRGGLVQQQHLGLERERTRQHHPLLLAHRQRESRRGRGRTRRAPPSAPAARDPPRAPRAAARTGRCPPRSRAPAPAAAARARPAAAARADRAHARPCRGSARRPRRDRRAGSSSRSSVDLPDPDGPSRAVEPDGIDSDTSAEHLPAVACEPDALEVENGPTRPRARPAAGRAGASRPVRACARRGRSCASPRTRR